MHRAAATVVIALIGVLAGTLLGCGGNSPVTKTVTVERRVDAPATPRQRARPVRVAKETSTTPRDGFVQCDANIEAKQATTTCGFAQNVFWHYWTSGESETLRVYSPATTTSFVTRCSLSGDSVVCRTDYDGEVRFAQSAVDNYSQTQADAYASGHDLGPDRYDSSSSSSEDGSAAGSPSDPGSPGASSSSAAPTGGQNIPNYENGNGYRVQCADGMYSHSGGIQGACSGHGGVAP